ncbi:hypothetical protein HON22_00915 [Candidatus Peregrinibacteria bacterium]|jgi:addiction module RelE/StbE family toxin|nr:hypothetical protein [Candidatus Peregrinibacteria bacterium]
MKIVFTSHFKKAFKKLSHKNQEDFFNKLEVLKVDMNHSQLRMHRLHGAMKDFFAFSLNYSVRVVFQYDQNSIYLYDIGSHKIYN